MRGVLKSTHFQGWCIFFVCLELLAFAFSTQLATRADFRSFYSAGAILRTSPGDLYNLTIQKQVQDALVSPQPRVLPFYHPAFEAALFVPFSTLSYRSAYLVWVAVSWIIAGLAFLFAPFEKRLTAFVAFSPVLMGIIGGQDSILLLLLCVLAFCELRRGSPASAGALIGLGIFRPQLAIPIAVLLAVRYGWRFFAGFAASGAVCGAISLALVGRRGFADFCNLLFRASLTTDHGSTSQRALAVYPGDMPNLFGLVHLLGDRYLKPHSEFIMIAVLSAIVFAVSAYFVRRSPSLELAFPIAICCALLVSYHMYGHDLGLLLIPFALLAGRLHLVLTGASYAVLYVLFFGLGLNWLAVAMAPVILGFCVLDIATIGSVKRMEQDGQAGQAVNLGFPIRSPESYS